MRWMWLLAVFALAAGLGSGQRADAATQTTADAAGTTAAAGANAAAAAVGGGSAAAPATVNPKIAYPGTASQGTASQGTANPGTVKVYEPRSPVTEPRLLPPDGTQAYPKSCNDDMAGESELSLLVDTNGRPRNLMFLRPSGTIADRFAIVIANRDRFAPGTLNGEPVVVAETLEVKVEACIGLEENAKGNLERRWLLKSEPKQKLKKPKNPPQVAELAPLNAPAAVKARMVKRPDFFGSGESAPVLIYSESAEYTPTRPKTKGSCEVSLVVDAHGLPEDLHVLKKLDPGLDRSALAAVEKYRFFPAIKGNQPVAAAVVVSVDFAPSRQ